MFIKVTSSGGRRYAQLVESFRNEEGQPRQRTIATLGRLEPGSDVDRLIASLQRAQGHEPIGGDAPLCVAAPPASAALELEFVDSRSYGDTWALWQLWTSLGLEGLSRAWARSRTELEVMACLRSMVFNRLCDASSKLGLLRWLDTVSLPVGFGFADALPSHQQLLRSMDVLDEHADAISDRLALLMRPLIDQDLSVVFYVLTTIKVHGEAVVGGVRPEAADAARTEGSTQDADAADVRQFGMSKSGLIERQFMLSLVQTAEGLPIAHEVHPGNTAEAATLLPMLRKLLARWPLKRVVLVADRGLLSIDNLQAIEALQAELERQAKALGTAPVKLEYVLAVPAARHGEFVQKLHELHAKHVAHDERDASSNGGNWVDETTWLHTDKALKAKTKVNVGAGSTQAATEPMSKSYRLVVAHDAQAAQRRTQARRSRIEELVTLGQQWGAKLDAQDEGQRSKGRPMSDSGAKARLYHAVKEAHLAHVIEVDMKTDVLQFSIDQDKLSYLERLDGKLILVTNTDAPPAEVVSRYKSLADIERGFHVLKSDIEIGPVYHRLPKRIRAHALVCFMALLLHRVLRMRLKANDREESPQRLLEQLRRIHHQTAQTPQGQRIDGLTQLQAAQRELFAAVGIAAPSTAQINPRPPRGQHTKTA
jgi:transposase